ncbi:LysM peptidoglycan-binding domain-containing protein [Hahella ganghwensis]|uniref:LysM peptidoglycan-binding domain-containing protein n=1 Tax=Hahella ganghwensis TaxID=286420 RepID=UPI0012FBAC53|nr:LysM domain-containing protein [Hahella ganghwensis]
MKSTFYKGAGEELDVQTNYFYNARDRFDSYKESRVEIDAIGDNVGKGTSYYAYNANGHNLFVFDHVEDRSLTYINNHRGQIIQRDEIDWEARGEEKPIRRKFFYLDGIVRGDIGNDDVASRTDYVQHLANTGDKNQVIGQQTRYWRGGNGDKPRIHSYEVDVKERIGYSNMKRVVPVTSADFDQNFQPINPEYPGKASSYYTTAEGDTLQAIAASQWGDSSLWYLLADANGFSGAETLTAGLNLVIPNVVTNVHNNAGTFRPYDPGLAIGDTTPTLPEPPPPPKGGKCGGAGIIVTIIAVAVTAIVAPYAATAIGNAMTALGTAGTTAGGFGLGAMATSTTVLSAAGSTFATAAGYAAGAMVGSAVSQVAAKGMGIQDHFSLRNVVRSGITAGATAGFGTYALINNLPQLATNIGSAAVAAGANYAAGSITDTAKTFRWRDVATSFLTSTAYSGLGSNTGNTLVDKGIGGAANSYVSSLAGSSKIAHESIHGLLAGTVSEGVRTAVFDSKDYRPDYVGMMAGVLGNTIGSLALAGIAGGRKTSQSLEQDSVIGHSMRQSTGLSDEAYERFEMYASSIGKTLSSYEKNVEELGFFGELWNMAVGLVGYELGEDGKYFSTVERDLKAYISNPEEYVIAKDMMSVETKLMTYLAVTDKRAQKILAKEIGLAKEEISDWGAAELAPLMTAAVVSVTTAKVLNGNSRANFQSFRQFIGASGERGHVTQLLGYWTKNVDGSRSLEDAIWTAERHGGFGDALDDVEKIREDIVELQTHDGLNIRFVSISDKVFDIEHKDKDAYYLPGKKYDPKAPGFNINKKETFESFFGGKTVTVQVRKSIFESDRAITAVLGHEFHELNGLFKKMRSGMQIASIQKHIDELHDSAVARSDKLVYKMMSNGF